MRQLYYLLARAGRWGEALQVRLMMNYGIHSYQPDPFGLLKGVRVDRDVRGTEEKWGLMKSHLPTQPYSALDVGCNIGFFSFRMAQTGADHVVGFETERGPILVAEKLKVLGRVGNVGFLVHRITPDNVELLGEYDVILFLSVFHHLVHAYDMEVAKRVLKVLLDRTRRTLFFETGQGDQEFGRMAHAMPRLSKNDVDTFIEDLLVECGAGQVTKIGETDLKNGATRGLYKVSM